MCMARRPDGVLGRFDLADLLRLPHLACLFFFHGLLSAEVGQFNQA